jgi:hypothetical protein
MKEAKLLKIGLDSGSSQKNEDYLNFYTLTILEYQFICVISKLISANSTKHSIIIKMSESKPLIGSSSQLEYPE